MCVGILLGFYVLSMYVHRIKKSVCDVQYQCGPLSTSGACMCAYVNGGVCMFCSPQACEYCTVISI